MPLVGAEVGHVDDVRVVQPRRRRRLAQEAGRRPGVGGQRRAHGLERDRLGDAGVDRLVDRAHAPAGQPLDDPVLAQHRAGRGSSPGRARGRARAARRCACGRPARSPCHPATDSCRFWVCDFSLRSPSLVGRAGASRSRASGRRAATRLSGLIEGAGTVLSQAAAARSAPPARSRRTGSGPRPAAGRPAVRKPSSKLRRPSPLAPSPAPVQLALPRYSSAPSITTALKCTRGHCRISNDPPPRDVAMRRRSALQAPGAGASSARNGRDGSPGVQQADLHPARHLLLEHRQHRPVGARLRVAWCAAARAGPAGPRPSAP